MPQPAPIALQLYSLRQELKTDFSGTVNKVAAIGYVGVEPFGVPDNLRQAADLYQQLGLEIGSAHVPMPLGDNKDNVLEIAAAYGVRHIIAGFGPDHFKTLDDTRRSCDRINDPSGR